MTLARRVAKSQTENLNWRALLRERRDRFTAATERRPPKDRRSFGFSDRPQVVWGLGAFMQWESGNPSRSDP